MKLPEFKSTTSASMQSAMMTPQLRDMTTKHVAAQHRPLAGQMNREDAAKNAMAKYLGVTAIAEGVGTMIKVYDTIDKASQQMAMEAAYSEYKIGMADFSASEQMTGGEIDPSTGKARHYGSADRYDSVSEQMLTGLREKYDFSRTELEHKFGLNVSGADYVNKDGLNSSSNKHRIERAKGDGLIAVNNERDPTKRDIIISDMRDSGLLTGVQTATLYNQTDDIRKDQQLAYQVATVRDSDINRLNVDREFTYSKEYTDKYGIKRAEALRSKMKERAITIAMDKVDDVSDKKSTAQLTSAYEGLLMTPYQELGVGSEKEKKELLSAVGTQINQYKSVIQSEGKASIGDIRKSTALSAARIDLDKDQVGAAPTRPYMGAEGKLRKEAEDITFAQAIPEGVLRGGEFAYDNLLDFTNKTNRPPKIYIEEIQQKVISGNLSDRLQATESLSSYLSDKPVMATYFNPEAMAMYAVISGAQEDGYPVEAAIREYSERKVSPNIKEYQETFKANNYSDGTEQTKQFEDYLSSDKNYEGTGVGGGIMGGIKAEVPVTMQNTYNRNFERAYMGPALGDAKAAHKYAYDQTMGSWGIENRGGEDVFINHSIYKKLGEGNNEAINMTMEQVLVDSGRVMQPDDEITAVYRGSVNGQDTWVVAVNGVNAVSAQGVVSINALDFAPAVGEQQKLDTIQSEEEAVYDSVVQSNVSEMGGLDEGTKASMVDGLSAFVGYAQIIGSYNLVKEAWQAAFDLNPDIQSEILRETGGEHIDGFMPSSIPVDIRQRMHDGAVEKETNRLIELQKQNEDVYNESYIRDRIAKYRKALIRRNMPMPDY